MSAVVVNAIVVSPEGSGGTLSLYPFGQTVGTNHPVVRSRGEDFAGMAIVPVGVGNKIVVATYLQDPSGGIAALSLTPSAPNHSGTAVNSTAGVLRVG